MPLKKTDITSHLIQTQELRNQVGRIFQDSLLLNARFQILSLSNTIRETLGFTTEELSHANVSILSKHCNLEHELSTRLGAGVFEETTLKLTTKSGQSITFSVSGFYLGLITDINDLIVIKLYNLEAINLVYDKLEAKTAEVDRFVYLSAHSLRGPLATMKGLLNLLKMSSNEEERIYLMDQIDVFGQKLDDKLHSLIYFAESDKGEEFGSEAFTTQVLGNQLKAFLEESTIDIPIDFRFNMNSLAEPIQNGHLVFSLLQNILSFFMHLPKQHTNQLTMDAKSSADDYLEITVRCHGFTMCEETQEQLHKVNFGYSEILKYPDLLTCYAAKKIIMKLKGNIQFILISNEDAFIHIVLPQSISNKSLLTNL